VYVYIQSEPGLYTVGHYDPSGKWIAESDHDTSAGAAARCAELNGAARPEPEANRPLRDRFAQHALMGLLAAEVDLGGAGAFTMRNGKVKLTTEPDNFATAAYLLADAMLKARDAKEGGN
jgi:hypothetical protein